MEKVETRGKEVRKCRWEETVRCPRLVGQFSIWRCWRWFCHLPKQLRGFKAGVSCDGNGVVDCHDMHWWLWWPWGGGQSRLIWMDMDWTQTYQIPLLDSGQGQLTPPRETGKDGDKIGLSLFMKPSWWGRWSRWWGWRSNVLRVKANRSETEGVVLLIVWNTRSQKVIVWNTIYITKWLSFTVWSLFPLF